jgi:hypothetical protein
VGHRESGHARAGPRATKKAGFGGRGPRADAGGPRATAGRQAGARAAINWRSSIPCSYSHWWMEQEGETRMERGLEKGNGFFLCSGVRGKRPPGFISVLLIMHLVGMEGSDLHSKPLAHAKAPAWDTRHCG